MFENPSAYWNLEKNGNAAVGNTNIEVGSGVSFGEVWSDGSSNGTLTSDNTTGIEIGNAAFTWGVWINFNSTSGSPFFLSKGFVPGFDYQNADLEWTLYYDSFANQFTLGWYIAGIGNSGTNLNLRASTFGAASTGTWYYVVFYYKPGSPNELGISINNGAFDTTTTTIAHASSGQNLTLFYRNGDGQYTNGGIRYLGFWKDLPTDAGGSVDLSYWYNGGAGRGL